MKFQTIRNRKHYVFGNEEEYRNYFIERNLEVPALVENWKDCEEGDWVVADDGGIVQILKRKDLPEDKKRQFYFRQVQHRGYCRTIVGTFFIHRYAEMDTDFTKHPNRYRFSPANILSKDFVLRREKLTKKEKRFVYAIVTGNDIIDSYRRIFGSLNNLDYRAALLLKQERVVTALQKSIKDIAKDLGIDHEYVLGRLKNIIDSSENERLVRDCVKDLGEAIGTFGQNVKTTTQVGAFGMFAGFDSEAVKSLGIEEAKQIESGSEE